VFYWVYDKETKRVLGPYGIGKITGLPFFCADTKVAPQGSTRKSDWRKVKEIPDFSEAVSALPPAPETGSSPEEGNAGEPRGKNDQENAKPGTKKSDASEEKKAEKKPPEKK